MISIEPYQDLTEFLVRLNNQHLPTKFDLIVSVGKIELHEIPLYIANSKEIQTKLFIKEIDHQSFIELAYSRSAALHN